MMKVHYLKTPINKNKIKNINSGDIIYLSGFIYTFRDKTHKRLLKYLENKKKLPISLKNLIIYYSGPTPTRPGKIIGSAGPTTSSRMDIYTSVLLDNGVIMTIGKGKRSKLIVKKIKETNSIYCATYGGAGAFIASKIKKAKLIAFHDLEAEGIYELLIDKMPLIVINDIHGNDFYRNKIIK